MWRRSNRSNRSKGVDHSVAEEEVEEYVPEEEDDFPQEEPVADYAEPDEPDEYSHWREKQKKVRRRTGLWRLITAIIAIIVVFAAAVVVYFSPLLAVKNITVRGNILISAEDITAHSGIIMGTPLVRVNDKAIANRVLRQFTAVRKTLVRKSFPHTIVITVVERVPVALTRDKRVLDEDGVVFGMKNSANKPGSSGYLPYFDSPNISPSDAVTRSALQAFTSLKDAIKAQVVSFSAHTTADITFQLDRHRTLLYGSFDRADDKNQAIEAILTRPGRFYDVSNPDLVVVR